MLSVVRPSSAYRSVAVAILTTAAVIAAAGCDGSAHEEGDAGPSIDGGPGPAMQDIVSTRLTIDLADLTGRAALTIYPGGGEVRLDAAGLTVTAVRLDGAPVDGAAADGEIRVPTRGDGAVDIEVDYGFAARPDDGFDGWMAARGLSFLWPTYCDNLFPCDQDPADGSTFELEVTGVDDGLVAVYPRTIPAPVPSYVPAVAVAAYGETALGTTTAGTRISAYALPGDALAMATGTRHLVDVVDFFERTYGAYRFGGHVASVEAGWGAGAYGGMEHHPFFHVASGAIASEEVHAHEAAHGWFGDGVRIACWEDFVLSEGTASYLAARALAAVDGPDLWPGYRAELADACEGADNTIALPDSCGVIDIASDPLWSTVPYMKGACFFREVAGLVGEGELDRALAAFYADHDDRPARMADLIDALADAAGGAGGAIETLADDWLRREECPADYAVRCGG